MNGHVGRHLQQRLGVGEDDLHTGLHEVVGDLLRRLCGDGEDAFQAIERVRRERDFELREVDITRDPGLNREYGERVPVVAVDGVERFEFFVDTAALAEALDRVDA